MSEPALEPEGVEPVGEQDGEESFAISREEWQQTQQQLAEAAELVQAVRANQQQEGPLSGYDPEFRKELDAWYDQKSASTREYQEHLRQQEGEEQLKDIFHHHSVADGEFDQDMAKLRYEQKFAPMMVEKYGVTRKAAEEAVAAAAREQRDYESQLRAQAVEQYQNQLRGISAAPREPAANGVPAAQQHVTPQGGDELALVRSYFPQAS